MDKEGVMTKCLTKVTRKWWKNGKMTPAVLLTMGRGYKISWNRSWSHSIHIWRLNMYLYKLDLQSIRL